MRRGLVIFLALALTYALVVGCSGGSGGGNVTLPEVQNPTAQSNHVGTYSWGSYQVIIDAKTSKVDIVQARGVDQIVNVVGFLEPPPLTNMTIDFDTLIIDDVAKTINVDVILKHPIPDPVFMGFDVRGVCMGPEVTNADGLTPVMNPADFSDVPFGYFDGLLGTPNSIGNYDGIWGYKYFCDDLGLTDDLVTFFSNEANLANRGVFRDGSQNARHYDLSWVNTVPPIDFFIFNYAIYANYEWPVGEAPIELDDFPITANSSEAFCFKATEVDNSLWFEDPSEGGTISLDVEVWDWQGALSQGVTLDDTITPDSSEAGNYSKSAIFHFVDIDPVLTDNTTISFKATVTDDKTYGEAWFMALMDPGHPMYGVNIYEVWTAGPFEIADTNPATGLSLRDSGPLPETPYTTAKEMCVVGSSANSKPGVYFFGNNYEVRYFALDYSAVSSYMTLVGNYGYSIGQWLGSPTDPKSIGVDGTGGLAATSNGTGIFFGSYQQNQCITWWQANNPVGQNGLTLSSSWGRARSRDVTPEFADYGTLWNSWAIEQDFLGVEIVMAGIGYPYNSGAYFTGWDVNWGPLDEVGGIDGEISDVEQSRFTMDSNPQGLTGGRNVIWYWLEKDDPSGTDTIEAAAHLKIVGSGMYQSLGSWKTFTGRPKDIDVWKSYPTIPDATGNWLIVLEDNGDTTWQCEVFDQAGTVVASTDTYNGTAMWVDANQFDTTPSFHVWVDDAGTITYYIFEWAI